MYKTWFKKYGGWLILCMLVIVFYKTFDDLALAFEYLKGIIGILSPFIIGAVFAYFLYIPTSRLEISLSKSSNDHIATHNRIYAVLIVFFSFLLFLVLALTYLIPTFIDNMQSLASQLPVYGEAALNFLNELANNTGMPDLYSSVNEAIVGWIKQLFSFDAEGSMAIVRHGINIVNVLLNWLMGLVICPYFLYERRNLLAIFDGMLGLFVDQKKIREVHEYANKINNIFSSFIFGKAIDSLIIGVLAYIIFTFMHLDYAIVLALVVMVTNMIPYFGPFIGGIPVVIITLIGMGPMMAIWTAVAIFALQQFDGLVLGPAILGESVGISPFWIIFAITFFGGLYGFIGMFIGVPLVAVIRMVVEDLLSKYYEKKNAS